MYSPRSVTIFVAIFICFSLFLLQIISSIFFSFNLSQLNVEFWLVNAFYYVIQFLFIFTVLCYERVRLLEVGEKIILKKKSISNVCLFLSLIGIAFMFIDRVYYRGIDYTSLNFVQIRNVLNANGNAKIGFSSLFSIFGNLFQYLFFYSVIYIFYYSNKKVKHEFLTFSSIVLCVGLTSFLLGGRSVVMLLLLFVLSLLIIKIISGEINFNFNEILKITFVGVAFLLLVLFLFGFVFYARASTGEVSVAEYYVSVADHLGVPLKETIVYNDISFLTTLYYVLGMVFMYLDHPLWLMNTIILDGGGDGVISISTPVLMLNKFIGFQLAQHDYSGYFISAPAAFYYDFGLLGLVMSPIALGMLFSYFYISWARNQKSFIRLFLFMSVISFIFFAPVLVITNFVIFLIIAIVMCVIDVVLSKRYRL